MPLTLTGKCSWFGGAKDFGVRPDEGLALIERSEIRDFASLFTPKQPPGTTGLARRLNPNAYYMAARWNYHVTPREWLRHTIVKVYNPANGREHDARPCDWGPNIKTDRVADLSPGLMKALGLVTNDVVRVTVPLPTDPKPKPPSEPDV